VLAVASVGAVAAALAAACGARSELASPSTAAGAGGGGNASAAVGTGGGGGPPDCVSFNSQATLAPLDVLVLMDASGSMTDVTPVGQKWWAVRIALEAFFAEPESAGVGAAIAFFPIIDEGVPNDCAADVDCGAPGMCQPLFACHPGDPRPCLDALDCSAGQVCTTRGRCSSAPDAICYPDLGIPCEPGLGTCSAALACENRYTCEAAAYETPVVGFSGLPGGGPAIIAAVDAKEKRGGTPTLPALTGAMAAAVERAARAPERKVVVLLATDGLPTVCDPVLNVPDKAQGVANVAAVANAGAAAGIQTFVVGVFSASEQAQAQDNLDIIAVSGGTEHAFVIGTSSTAPTELLAALRKVRVSASCEFVLELPAGEPVDYTEIWVRFVDPMSGAELWIPRVPSAAACHPVTGGFHYDVPLGGSVPPSRIRLCPATCALLDTTSIPTIEIFTACPDPAGQGP
jgi:hypothetical protein